MQMIAWRLIKHQRTQQFDSNNQMRWRRRDVMIASRFAEATFSLTGGDEAEFIDDPVWRHDGRKWREGRYASG